MLVNTVTIPLWLVLARALPSAPRPSTFTKRSAPSAHCRRVALAAPLPLADDVVFNSETSRVCRPLWLKERRGHVRVVHNGVSGSCTPCTEAQRTVLEPPFRA